MLLAVLVFIMLLSMVTVSLLFRSRAEETAASASAGAEQAWAAALSGVQEALRVASSSAAGTDEWLDNPAAFRERLVFEDGADRWLFTVYSPGDSESLTEVRSGLSDEASRVNLNHPGGVDLAKIPRMTAAMVQSLRQFTGGQTNGTMTAVEVAPAPAESAEPPPSLDSLGEFLETDPDEMEFSSYSEATPRRPLASLEELAGIPGFSRTLLFGEDANFNGRLDPNENDGDEHLPPDNRDGRLDHGMAQYFTVTAYDPDRTRAGKLRVDLNSAVEVLPPADLPATFTNYVAALRAAKIKLVHPVDVLEAVAKTKNEQGQDVEVASGITKEQLPLILDLFTTDGEGRHEGLINLNTANAIVLATLPGVDAALAETIVSTRTAVRPEQRLTPAWLLTEGVVDAEKFKLLAPFLTARSFQFSFHVIGYSLPAGRYRVLDVKIDVAGSEPRVTSLRDITRLGLPFKLQAETLEKSAPGTAQSRPAVSPIPKLIHG